MNNVTSYNPKDGIQARKHRKENSFLYSFTVVVFDIHKELSEYDRSRFDTPIELRIYGTRAKNYACLWILDHSGRSKTTANGSGAAGGYGYHRPSEAAEIAINTAGITLEKPIGGRGNEAIKDALTAIAVHLGYNTDEFTIIHSHA